MLDVEYAFGYGGDMLTQSAFLAYLDAATGAVADFVRSFPAAHGFWFGMMLGFLVMQVLRETLRAVDSYRLRHGESPILPRYGFRPRHDMRTLAQRREDAAFMAMARTYHRED